MDDKKIIKDSGSTREFDTGAHRDSAVGKGRCDLLPGAYVAKAAKKIDEVSFRIVCSYPEAAIVELVCGATNEAMKSMWTREGFLDSLSQIIAMTAIAEGIRMNLETHDVDITVVNDNDDEFIAIYRAFWYGIIQVSKHYEEGGKKYGYNNWKKGMQTHVYFDSMCRHLMKAAAGMEDEPHIRAACWNALCLAWTMEIIPELDDMLFDTDYPCSNKKE